MTTDTTDPNADLAAEAAAALAGADVPELAPPIGSDPPPVDAAQQAAENAAALTALLDLTFNKALAPRLGDHWKLEREESESLGSAYSVVLDKYFPNWRTGPEITALVVSFAVFGPRVATSIALQREKINGQKTDQPEGTRGSELTGNVDRA